MPKLIRRTINWGCMDRHTPIIEKLFVKKVFSLYKTSYKRNNEKSRGVIEAKILYNLRCVIRLDQSNG